MALPPQRIRFCTSRDGTRIAFAVTGEGPPLVKVPNLSSHLEVEPENAVLGPWIAELARQRTLVRYDLRGFGVSDQEVEDFSVERHLEDLAAVVEAAGLQRFALIGLAGSIVSCVLYAARQPERVTHLVLYGGFLLGRRRHGPLRPSRRPKWKCCCDSWRSAGARTIPRFASCIPRRSFPMAPWQQFRSFNDLMRRAASPENAVRYLREMHGVDLRAAASQVRCPALVVHARDDRRVPVEQGRALAAAIAGSRRRRSIRAIIWCCRRILRGGSSSPS